MAYLEVLFTRPPRYCATFEVSDHECGLLARHRLALEDGDASKEITELFQEVIQRTPVDTAQDPPKLFLESRVRR